MSIDGQRAGSTQHRVSPVAAGLAVFAGALMIVSGIGAVFQGRQPDRDALQRTQPLTRVVEHLNAVGQGGKCLSWRPHDQHLTVHSTAHQAADVTQQR